LRTLQAAANNNQSSASLTWDAFNKINSNSGAPFVDIDSFAQRFEADPIVQQFVDRYDESGLVIKTNQAMPDPLTQHKEPESAVSKMARSALKRIKK
jgi:hypothetical protein